MPHPPRSSRRRNPRHLRPGLLALLLAALLLPAANDAARAQADYPAPPLAAFDLADTDYPVPKENVFFAAPNGSPDAPGTSPAAPTTAARAVELAPAGGTVVFRGGEYRGVVIDLRKPLNLQAYPREKPLFKGSDLVSGWTPEPAGENNTPRAAWRHDGWNKPFPAVMGKEFLDKAFPLASRREQVFVGGRPLRQVATRAEVGPGCFCYDDASKSLWLGDDPAGQPVEVTARQRAMLLKFRTEGGDPSGSKLRGLSFAHHADQGVFFQAHNLVVEDCAFLWNAVDGANFGGINLTVRRSVFACNGRKGAGVTIINPREPTRDVLFEDCAFRYNNAEHFRGGWDASGIKVTRTRNITFRNCRWEGNFGCNALWLDISVFDANVVGCRFQDGGSSGVMVELCTRVNVVNNLFLGERAHGVSVWDSSHTRVANNTFVRCRVNVAVHDTVRVNDPTREEGKEFGIHGQNLAEAQDGATWTSHDIFIQNNVFAGTTTPTLIDAANCTRATGGRYNGASAATMIAALDHNAYVRAAPALPPLPKPRVAPFPPGKPAPAPKPDATEAPTPPATAPTPASTKAPPAAVHWSRGAEAGDCDSRYASVAEFREANPPFEAHAVFADDAAALFADAARGDYRPRPGSPLAGAGAPLPEPVAKLLGVPPGKPVDLGARLAP